MKWTDKRIREYLNDGNKVMLSAQNEPGMVGWVNWVRQSNTNHILTPEIYNQLNTYDKRRVKYFLGDNNCFPYFYNKRLKAYEAERDALDN